jgi:chaperonin GroEL (HSP60 family)
LEELELSKKSALELNLIKWLSLKTILVKGGSTMIVYETRRSIHDVLCAIRNIVRNPRIIYGGAAEVACSLAVSSWHDTVKYY